VGDETRVSVRYFISNKDIPAEGFGTDIRGHWCLAPLALPCVYIYPAVFSDYS
jgi:hypothetical protein